MDKKTLEHQIQEVLTVDMSAAALSQLLFSPEGLFNDLAAFASNRQEVAQLPLYRQAMARFRELVNKESTGLGGEVDRINAALARGKVAAQSIDGNGAVSDVTSPQTSQRGVA